ncbi:MAG: DUF2497 domain-containing protein [Alphaproteobacteria bacterium]|nr:DUF2497 domain-containing protein [Alphaproteobacteria bacterium]
MGDMTKEPSMEEILSSIKRIIAEESETPKSAPRSPLRGKSKAKLPVQPDDSADEALRAVESPDADGDADEILELTDEVAPEVEGQQAEPLHGQPEMVSDMSVETILSNETAAASRHSLAALSALLIRPDDAPSNTLEGLVRDMLRPMLKEWLDANLPDLVEKIVAKEIARLSDRPF